MALRSSSALAKVLFPSALGGSVPGFSRMGGASSCGLHAFAFTSSSSKTWGLERLHCHHLAVSVCAHTALT